MEMVRAVSSGTEATMSALRLARGFTGRDKIIKTDGGYHGHADCLLVAAGSGAATLGIPGSAGVPEGAARDTIVVPYNDLAAVEAAFAATPARSPRSSSSRSPATWASSCPRPATSRACARSRTKHGTLLIFDEVMTGFRVAYGGAQALYGITPDLTCLGKIVGGGLPAAAFGGRADIMQKLAPLGPVYQAGTLSGNPLAMAAGLKAIEILGRPGTYERLEQLGKRLGDGLAAAASGRRSPAVHEPGRLDADPVLHARARSPTTRPRRPPTPRGSARSSAAMRERGVFLPPSQFEAMFVSLAHTDEDVDQVIACREGAASLD